jgi:hypothetical protein|tara:strand:- start:497 stop:844 length:348 start_codon:yes stop_codon:yes gene_type:complete
MFGIYDSDGWSAYLVATAPTEFAAQCFINRMKAHPNSRFSRLCDVDSLFIKPVRHLVDLGDHEDLVQSLIPDWAGDDQREFERQEACREIDRTVKQARAQKQPLSNQGFDWWPAS